MCSRYKPTEPGKMAKDLAPYLQAIEILCDLEFLMDRGLGSPEMAWAKASVPRCLRSFGVLCKFRASQLPLVLSQH